jgi:hypothetical protein
LAQPTIIMALSVQSFMATSVGPRLPPSPTSIASRYAKLLMKIDQVTVMVARLAETGQLMFNRQQ